MNREDKLKARVASVANANRRATTINNFKEIISFGSYWINWINRRREEDKAHKMVAQTIIGYRRRMKWKQLRKDLEDIQRMKIAA